MKDPLDIVDIIVGGGFMIALILLAATPIVAILMRGCS